MHNRCSGKEAIAVLTQDEFYPLIQKALVNASEKETLSYIREMIPCTQNPYGVIRA